MCAVTTDYACQAAAQQAAGGIAGVRAVLVPAPRSAARQDDLPIVLRQYLGVPDRPEGPPEPEVWDPPPAPASMGTAVLLVLLDGLRAELEGSLPEWYSSLFDRIPQALGAPSATARQGPSSSGWTEDWQNTAALQHGAHEVLTALRSCASASGSAGSSALAVRLALVEDILCGALRRMNVPFDTAARCASELAAATASIYGLSSPAATAVP